MDIFGPAVAGRVRPFSRGISDILTHPMDSRPWDAISFTFQGGIIALFDVNKAATLRVHGHHRRRDAHLQIMAQSHWRLLWRPLHFARIIAYQETKTSLDMHEMKVMGPNSSIKIFKKSFSKVYYF